MQCDSHREPVRVSLEDKLECGFHCLTVTLPSYGAMPMRGGWQVLVRGKTIDAPESCGAWGWGVAFEAHCRIMSGWMLNSRSSLPRRTSSSNAVSSASASCRSPVLVSTRPFNLTMMSPSLIPPLSENAKRSGNRKGEPCWMHKSCLIKLRFLNRHFKKIEY